MIQVKASERNWCKRMLDSIFGAAGHMVSDKFFFFFSLLVKIH